MWLVAPAVAPGPGAVQRSRGRGRVRTQATLAILVTHRRSRSSRAARCLARRAPIVASTATTMCKGSQRSTSSGPTRPCTQSIYFVGAKWSDATNYVKPDHCITLIAAANGQCFQTVACRSYRHNHAYVQLRLRNATNCAFKDTPQL